MSGHYNLTKGFSGQAKTIGKLLGAVV